jgi:hypothetical protein
MATVRASDPQARPQRPRRVSSAQKRKPSHKASHDAVIAIANEAASSTGS